MTLDRISRVALGALSLAVLLVVFGSPLLGWPRVVRLPAVLFPAILLALLIVRPWRWPDINRIAVEWQPSARFLWTAAVVAGALLFWYVLTRFWSGEINAIDFTVYYDRPCYQTTQGRPLFVEVSDTPGFSYRSEFADHAYWALLPICSVYLINPSPLWLHALSAIAIVAGSFYALRILQRLGAGGVLACATALAFILNDNTARTLNYGFHPEVLYAWFVPWMIDAGLRGARGPFLVAVLACVSVKEDACLPILAATTALALHRWSGMTWADRRIFLVLPNVLALANLAVYYGYVTPLLAGKAGASYAHFWGNYGDTPTMVLLAMASQPLNVAKGVLSSGIFRVILPHLYLPLVGWRWAIGLLPLVAIYGASNNDQVRGFGIYYAIVTVPFLVIAASWGALVVARRFLASEGKAQLAAAAVVVSGALLVESWHRGYSLRPWKAAVAAVPEAVRQLSKEPVVLVQSGLFPHAGYGESFKLLTPETLSDPRHQNAVVLLAQGVGAYPFPGGRKHKDEVLARLMELPQVIDLPGELKAVRLPKSAAP